MDLIAAIDEYFAKHRDDGDFMRPSRAEPYSIIGPPDTDSPIIIATKGYVISTAVEQSGDDAPFGMIGRYGLPSEEDLGWIREFMGGRTTFFLGDMDPPDLLAFAWLRARLHPQTVVHLGVSQSLCADLRVVVPDSFTILMPPSERNAVPVLDSVMPDWPQIVGAEYAAILRSGRKIEVEAIVSATGTAAPILTLLARQRR